MQFSDHFLTLFTAAEAYFYLGWSVIPLLGDLDSSRPKVAAIPWAEFQHRHASLQEQREWFREDRFAGLGLVTGRISQLVVLDFDSEQVFKDFRIRFPDLVETHTVRSAGRQLPHLYFRLPPHLYVSSRKGQGVDLLSDGRYVVAPPTTIAAQAYKITRGGMPKTLTERDIRRIKAFMDSNKDDSKLEKYETSPQVTFSAEKTTARDILALYHYLTNKEGRNEALFHTSLYARDAGWTQRQTETYLVTQHSQQLASGCHHRETSAQRQREAIRTIRSAFSRPARPLATQTRHHSLQFSNSAREAFMQQEMTYFVRTYEGLLQAGIHPGQGILAKEAVERLKGVVGRDSVLKALKAGQGGQGFFAPPVSPSRTANAVATDNSLIDSDKCLSEGSNLQEKVKMGRPQHRYRMPSNEEICAILGVKATGSDLLETTDLASAHQTRMALHRELIKRRPEHYARSWLARRVGVSTRTIATYNKRIPIHSRAVHIETSITWKTIERLPFDDPIRGAVLVTVKGKRYPALRTIASRLLARGECVTLKQQTVNFYWYGDEDPIMARLQVQQEVEIRQEKIEAFIAQQPQVHAVIEKQLQPAPKPMKLKPKSVGNLRRPLKNATHEAQAQHLYRTLNQLGHKHLSLANARRLVTTYPETDILKSMSLLRQRPQITNPTGFLVTTLRSAQK